MKPSSEILSSAPPTTMGKSPKFDVQQIRDDFPILSTLTNGKKLVYLDNGATTQKPRAVIDALSAYYESQNANIHRGVYALSQLATTKYEETRRKIRKFINAAEGREIIYTRGTTESINLVASSYGRANLRAGDEVVVSAMEHHSNIVPWQMICEQTGAKLRVIPMNDRGELLLDEYEKILAGGKVKIVAVVHLSNSLGTINDVKRITKLAYDRGAVVLIDGAQWAAHHATDVRDIGCDFYAFSGHKLFGPTGIGVLYGKAKLLEAMPPYQGGGDMIASVTFEKTEYADLPNKFEAGTPHIAGVVGLGAAIDYVSSIGFDKIASHEVDLLDYATKRFAEVPGLRIIGNAANKGSVISFVLDNPRIASHDIGVVLDMAGVAIRTGHHCCQPVMDRMGISSTARISLAMYNTHQDIDAAVDALKKVAASVKPRAAAKSNGEVEYPQAVAPTPQAAADELIEVFDALGDDPNAKSLFLMEDLGEKLPNLFDLLKKATTRLPGCMSEVYFVGRRSPKDATRLEFVADANAAIVRGEIAMLERIFAGQRAAEILAFDVEGFFEKRIGLEQFLTSQRRTGMASMVHRIRTLAQEVRPARQVERDIESDMSEPTDPTPQRQPLNVINTSSKVEQLRKEAAADPKPPKHVDTTIVSRFCDSNKTAKQKMIEEKVIDAIRQVYDPEIPVNIYDLGLIYGIDVDDATGKVQVRMTLTAPACPVAGQIVAEVERRAEAIDEVPSAKVELVWEPRWSREMMSEAAQLELGLL